MEKVLDKNYKISIVSMAFMMGGFSAFINNTPVVATFIPVVNRTTKKLKRSPSKYLIPLSYLAIFGGMCTLIGTSTNLLVSGMASDRGFGDFQMFSLAPVGLCLLVIGVMYLMFAARYLLPNMGTKDLMEEEEDIKQFLAEVSLKEKSEEKDLTLNNFIEDNNIEIKVLKRNGETEKNPDRSKKLKKGDTLLIEGSL